MKVIKNNLSFF